MRARLADEHARVEHEHPQLVQRVLERTLGIPIFQEQVIELAMVAAGFSAGEADQLRRAMAAWKKRGGLEHFKQKLIDGMLARGHDKAFAERVFKQIQGQHYVILLYKKLSKIL